MSRQGIPFRWKTGRRRSIFLFGKMTRKSLAQILSSGRNRLKEAGAGTSPGMYRLLLCYILIIYDYAQMNQKYRYPVITAVKV